jgi:hypothetical protein
MAFPRVNSSNDIPFAVKKPFHFKFQVVQLVQLTILDLNSACGATGRIIIMSEMLGGTKQAIGMVSLCVATFNLES